jgi:hypothetical protein
MLCRGRFKRSATPSATSPLPACFNTHNKTTQIIERVAAIVANNKTKANRDNQLAAVVALPTTVVEMASAEATLAVADTIRVAA